MTTYDTLTLKITIDRDLLDDSDYIETTVQLLADQARRKLTEGATDANILVDTIEDAVAESKANPGVTVEVRP